MNPLSRFLVLVALGSAACHAASKPNVVIILGADMGYSDLGCYCSETWADRVGVQPRPIKRRWR